MEKEKEGKEIINIDLDDDGDENGEEDDTNQSNAENSVLQAENSGSPCSKKKKKMTKAVLDILTSSNTKFLSNFDPELSNRERRKLTRKLNTEGKKIGSGNDDNSASNGLEKDVCDCLKEDCPGCHFPCPKCRSCKCGLECRVNRKWMYEGIENEAETAISKNKCRKETRIPQYVDVKEERENQLNAKGI